MAKGKNLSKGYGTGVLICMKEPTPTTPGVYWRRFGRPGIDQKAETFTAKTLTEARRVHADRVAMARRLRGEQVDADAERNAQRTVGDLLTEWLDFAEPNLAPQSVRQYRHAVEHYLRPTLGPVLLDNLDAHTVDMVARRWLASGGRGGRKLGPQTVVNLVKVLHAALRQGQRWDWCTTAATGNATKPKIKDKVVAIPEGDLAKIVKVARASDDTRLRMLVELAAGTGARRGELLGLQWRDFCLDALGSVGEPKPTVTIRRSRTSSGLGDTKTKAGIRTIDIDPALAAFLKAHEGAPNAQVIDMHPSWSDKVWRKHVEALGLSYHIHQVRHSVASRLIASGLDLVEVARIMGHAHAGITLKIYGHSPEKPTTSVAALLDWNTDATDEDAA